MSNDKDWRGWNERESEGLGCGSVDDDSFRRAAQIGKVQFGSPGQPAHHRQTRYAARPVGQLIMVLDYCLSIAPRTILYHARSGSTGCVMHFVLLCYYGLATCDMLIHCVAASSAQAGHSLGPLCEDNASQRKRS